MNELALFNTLFGTPDFRCAAPRFNRMPQTDVEQNENSYVITMELPGKTQDDVDITLKDNILKIASVKKEEKTEENNAEFLLKERYVSEFERSFQLPKDIDAENTSAKFANGILTITVARKECEAERKIQIMAA